MNDYLLKPVDERLLYSRIVGILKKPKFAKLNEKLEEKGTTKKKTRCIDLVNLNQRTKSNPALMMEIILLSHL